VSALAAGIRRLWDSLFAVAFALAGFQFPAVMEIFRQRLDQKMVETVRLLGDLRKSDTPDAGSIARLEAALPRIRQAVDELGQDGFARLRGFFANFDAEIVWRIVSTNYRPSLPLTVEGLVYAAAAAVLGLIIAAILARIVRALLFRSRRRMESY